MHDYTAMTAHADHHRRDAHERAAARRLVREARAARIPASSVESPRPARRPLTWFFPRLRQAGGRA